MKKNTHHIVILLLLFVAGLVLANVCYAKDNDAIKQSLEKDRLKADKLVKTLPVTEVLGPLAPVAISPFFGLTCLSGASILSDKGVLPENSFLTGSEVLNNGFVFTAFLLLTIVTAAPKLFTASKLFAQAGDKLDTYAGVISYAVIIMLAGQSMTAEPDKVVYSAGIFTFSEQTLLVLAAAVNVIVINTVKAFFELLTLISPIPMLDAAIEVANKAVCGALIAVYVFNPWLAFVINLIIFLFCLMIYRWVKRRVAYIKALLLDPLLVPVKRFFRKDYQPSLSGLRRLASHIPGIELLVKCFPMRKLPGIKKKDLCYLVFGKDGISLAKPRFLRAPIIRKIEGANLSSEIEGGMLSYSVEISEADSAKPCELVFGGAYKEALDQIKAKLK